MATINSKKLLPSSTKGSAIEKPKFLVPVKNISTKKITGSDLKPIDKKSDTSGSLVVIKNKLIDINNVFKSTYLINKKTNERKRKESETQKSKERETKLEKKEQKTFTFGIIKSVPGGSIIDAINRFIGFTLLGYIFNNYAKYLPKLIKLGAKLAPAMKFFESFAKTLLDKTITFVDLGYKAFDAVKKTVKDIGGKNYEKIFNDFSDNLNKALNVALVIAGLAISKKGPGEGGGARGTTSFLSSLLRGKAPTKASDASIAKRLAARRLAEARRSRLSQRLQQNAKKARAAELARQLEPGRGIYKKTPQLSGVTQYVGVGGRADVRDPSVVDKLNKLLERSSPGELKSGTKKIKLGDLKSRGIPRGSKPASLSIPKPSGVPSGLVAKGAGSAKSFLKVASVPVVSALADFIISYFILKEKPGRAAASAIGSGIGTLLGTAATTALGLGTGGIGAAILGGAIIGGSSMVGSAFGTTLYDAVVGAKKSFGFAQGGQVSRGGKTRGAPSRTLKTKTRKAPPKIQPQKTQPGKDVGGKLKIEELYGKDEPGKRSALRALRKSSDDVKRMRSINGLAGSMFGAGIDMALGQKPDKNLSRNLGNIFGSVIASAVDMELNNSFGDISRSIAMANGGTVPSRQIGKSLSIGERIGNFISRALAVSIESSATRILQNLRNEMNLEGGAPGGGDGMPPGEVPAADISDDQRKASNDLIKYFEKLYGKNGAIGVVANLLRESGLRTTTPDNASYEGMAQWDRAHRWPAFVKWAQSKGKDPYSRSAQAEWIAIELKQLGTDARLKNAKTPEEAASLFYNEFERAAYSKPILGDKYTPDNPHERKNRSFIQSLVGGSSVAPPAMVTGGLKPSQIQQTSPQGWRWGRMHKGIDLDGGDGSPISSAQDATVVWAGDKGDGYGNSVVLRYSNGAETRFAHLKSLNVRKGQSIKAGQLIGRQGNTGSSTASHLHFEYYPSGGAMTYEGYGNATSVKDSYFRYGGNVKPKFLSTPPDIFNIGDKKSQDKNKPSDIFNWNQSSVAPSQTSTVASLNRTGALKEHTSGAVALIQKDIYLATQIIETA
jgi:murein DD-endopeptidase MepM/ murein hydrolase activator NlpD